MSVERIAERDIETDFGPFRLYCYEDHVNGTVHLALARLKRALAGAFERELGPDVSLRVEAYRKDYARLRIGIGRPRSSTIAHVLSKFSKEEEADLERIVASAASNVKLWADRGIIEAMNAVNDPANQPLASIDTSALRHWVLFDMGQTAAVGPWGISYAANISSDATGIGTWTEAQFFTAIRKGKYQGQKGVTLPRL